jgi:site-specific DNA recombinase
MKVIGYIRVSTNNQDLKRQEVKVKEHCSINNYEVVKIIQDFAISGAVRDRKGYLELLSLTKNDADMIVVSELSRLSRQEDLMDTLKDIDNIIKNGFKLQFLDQPSKIYEGSLDFLEIISLSFKAYGAAQERQAIKRRNQEGKEVLFKNHCYAIVDGAIPYGYTKVPNPNGTHPKFYLKEVEEEVKIIQKIYELIIDGMSLAKIVKHLFNSGVRHSGDKIFTKQYLSKLIANPIFKGERIRKGVINQIDPIIDPSIWDAAQVKIKENKYYSSSGTTLFNPLKGILRCRCGRAMVVKNKYANVNIYRCSQVQPEFLPNKCEYKDAIRYEFTNATMLAYLKSLDFVEVVGRISDKINLYSSEIKGIENLIATEKDKLSELERKLANYYESFAETDNKELRKVILSKIDTANDDISLIKKSITRKEKDILAIKGRIRDLEQYSRTEDFENLDIQSQANLFRKYINKIEFLPVTTMQGFYKIDLNIGITEYIAIRKTKRNPLIVKVPLSLTINEDLTISYTDYDISTESYIELVSTGTKNITIQEYFKKYSEEDVLNVDLSYRDFIVSNE